MPGGGGGMDESSIHRLAQTQSVLNRPNTSSQIYGGTTWQQDPNRPDYFTEVQNLGPVGQQRFDLANQLAGRLGNDMQGWDPSNFTDISMDPNFEQQQQEEAYKFATGNMDPQWAVQEQQLKGQMAAQGLHPGDPGYSQAMDQFQRQKAQAYNQAQSGSYQTGVNAGAQRQATRISTMQAQIAEQLQRSGWTLGQINALLGGSGMPGQPGGQAPGADMMGLTVQNQLAQQQMQAQAANSGIGALATIGGAAIAASDVTVKEDFADPTPALEEFLNSAEPSEYSYKPDVAPVFGESRYVSPMAQNLERSQIGRSMVVEAPDGTKMVDYGKSFGSVLGALSHLNKKLNRIMGL